MLILLGIVLVVLGGLWFVGHRGATMLLTLDLLVWDKLGYTLSPTYRKTSGVLAMVFGLLCFAAYAWVASTQWV